MAYSAKKYQFINSVKKWPRNAGLLFIALVFAAFYNLNAQNAYTSGTEFMLSYGDVIKNFDNWYAGGTRDTSTQVSLLLIGTNEACIRLRIADLNYTQTVFVQHDSVLEITLPLIPIYPFESVHNYGLQVESNAPINVVMCINPHGGKDTIFWRGYAGLAEASSQMPNKVMAFEVFATIILAPLAASLGFSPIIFPSLTSLENDNYVEFKLRADAFLDINGISLNQISRYADTTYLITLQKGEQINLLTVGYMGVIPSPNKYFVGSYFKSLNNKKFNLQVSAGNSDCLSDLSIAGQISKW